MNFDKDKKDLMYDESVLDNNLLGEDTVSIYKDLVRLKRKNKMVYSEDDINKSDKYYDSLTRSLNKYYDNL